MIQCLFKDHVTIEYSIFDNEIEITSIVTDLDFINNGYATKVLGELCKDLLLLKKPIYLQAYPCSHCSLTREQLIRWYEKMGFYKHQTRDRMYYRGER